MSKVSKSWTVKVRGHKQRTVGVRRKPWLGIGIVEVDGERVEMFAAKALSMGFSSHPEIHFEVSGVSCMLKIHPGMLAYDYELYVDGKLLEPDVW